MSERPIAPKRRNVTVLALLGMVTGFAVGLLAKESGAPLLLQLKEVAEPVGVVWTNALRMIVIPLMVSYIVLAINSAASARTAGKLGGLAMISYLAMLASAAVFTFTIGAELVTMIPADEAARSAFRSLGGRADIPVVTPSASAPSVTGWLTAMVPSNPFRAAVDDNFIGVVVSTVLFALAILQISAEKRRTLIGFFEAAAETSSVVIGWIIYLLPVAAFALSYVIAIETGLSVATSIGYYVAVLSALLFTMTVLLYPVTAVIARVSIKRFFAAVAPALAVGAGTRSSIAALPAMLDGAENKLGVRREVSGFILPLSVSTFKLNPAISQPCELMFFIAMFDLSPSPAALLSFSVTTLLLSFASAGIPSGSKLLSWPVFLAMGVPVEALVMMKIIDAIPDIFKTLLNVTADMSVTVIVQRFSRSALPGPASAPSLAPTTE